MANCRELTSDELDLVSGGYYIPGEGWVVTGNSGSSDWGMGSLDFWIDASSSASEYTGAAGGFAALAAGAQLGANIPLDAIAITLGTASLGFEITSKELSGIRYALQ